MEKIEEHVQCDPKRKHGLFYTENGARCRVENCEVNFKKDNSKTKFLIFDAIKEEY